MDINQNVSSAPQNNQEPSHHKHWIPILIFLVVAVIVAVLLIFQAKWTDLGFQNSEINDSKSDAGSFNSELDSVDLGDLDKELDQVDKDLSGL